MSLWDRMATVSCSTKRNPDVADGKRGARATHLKDVSIVSLMPASTQTLRHPAFQSLAVELWETFTHSHEHTDDGETVTQVPDIHQGDVLVVGGEDYYVQFVGEWPATSYTDAYLHIVVQEHKP